MNKIKRIKFHNDPILGNLILDFCDSSGNAVDTVIIAGENGCGKSSVLNYIYSIMTGQVKYESEVELESKNEPIIWSFYDNPRHRTSSLWVKTSDKIETLPGNDDFKKNYCTYGIFSDVDINFHSQDISSVTSMVLDSANDSQRSNNNLPKMIKQLIIDIQAQDDAEVSRVANDNPDKTFRECKIERRMSRFTQAFNKMFDSLQYSHIKNESGQKSIIFKKKGVEIPIESLSSGEKQIVYRGCFLLKDVNALNGACVLIDEPEISLHPSWQEKIMEYYKGIFTDSQGIQTSQIFAVTHSPFIIHNENRSNDKVIILARNENGDIVVKDKPEYYKCNSIEAVKDAFSIWSFPTEKSIVYLEGRTDELYFKKAAEVFGYKRLPFEFQWVGHMNGDKEENTGKDALNKAVSFLIGRNLSTKNVCLFDCDTSKSNSVNNNVYTLVLPTYSNSTGMKKGIENALVLDSIDLKPYYSEKTKEGDYGDNSTIVTFEKMKLCEAICRMKSASLKVIMRNLKDVIDQIWDIFKE